MGKIDIHFPFQLYIYIYSNFFIAFTFLSKINKIVHKFSFKLLSKSKLTFLLKLEEIIKLFTYLHMDKIK